MPATYKPPHKQDAAVPSTVFKPWVCDALAQRYKLGPSQRALEGFLIEGTNVTTAEAQVLLIEAVQQVGNMGNPVSQRAFQMLDMGDMNGMAVIGQTIYKTVVAMAHQLPSIGRVFRYVDLDVLRIAREEFELTILTAHTEELARHVRAPVASHRTIKISYASTGIHACVVWDSTKLDWDGMLEFMRQTIAVSVALFLSVAEFYAYNVVRLPTPIGLRNVPVCADMVSLLTHCVEGVLNTGSVQRLAAAVRPWQPNILSPGFKYHVIMHDEAATQASLTDGMMLAWTDVGGYNGQLGDKVGTPGVGFEVYSIGGGALAKGCGREGYGNTTSCYIRVTVIRPAGHTGKLFTYVPNSYSSRLERVETNSTAGGGVDANSVYHCDAEHAVIRVALIQSTGYSVVIEPHKATTLRITNIRSMRGTDELQMDATVRSFMHMQLVQNNTDGSLMLPVGVARMYEEKPECVADARLQRAGQYRDIKITADAYKSMFAVAPLDASVLPVHMTGVARSGRVNTISDPGTISDAVKAIIEPRLYAMPSPDKEEDDNWAIVREIVQTRYMLMMRGPSAIVGDDNRLLFTVQSAEPPAVAYVLNQQMRAVTGWREV